MLRKAILRASGNKALHDEDLIFARQLAAARDAAPEARAFVPDWYAFSGSDVMILARLKAFAQFWYDFIIGDDWRVALGVVLALALTYWLSHSTRASPTTR